MQSNLTVANINISLSVKCYCSALVHQNAEAPSTYGNGYAWLPSVSPPVLSSLNKAQGLNLQYFRQVGARLQLILQILYTAGGIDVSHSLLLLVSSQQNGLAGIGLKM